jgi:hypothetical protein
MVIPAPPTVVDVTDRTAEADRADRAVGADAPATARPHTAAALDGAPDAR